MKVVEGLKVMYVIHEKRSSNQLNRNGRFHAAVSGERKETTFISL